MDSYKRYKQYTRLLTESSPIPLKFAEEAELKGYELLVLFDKQALYRRKICGHLSIASVSNVRHQSRSVCVQCRDKSHNNLLETRGVSIIEHISTLQAKIKINQCGHIQTTAKSNLYSHTTKFKCLQCVEEGINSLCEEKNLTLLNRKAPHNLVSHLQRSQNYMHLKYNDCGHDFVAMPSHLKRVGKCETCIQDNHTLKLKANGYNLLKMTSTAKGLFSFDKCGHERELYLSAALRGNAICNKCNVSTFDLPSKIYLFKFTTTDGVEFLKLGYGKNLRERVREYRPKGCCLTATLIDIDVLTGRQALEIEKLVHAKLKEFRLPSEKMKKYLTRGGYSECYPCESEQLIYNSLNEVMNG